MTRPWIRSHGSQREGPWLEAPQHGERVHPLGAAAGKRGLYVPEYPLAGDVRRYRKEGQANAASVACRLSLCARPERRRIRLMVLRQKRTACAAGLPK